ncbi:MAG: histidine phosphatase family protein [Bacteroidales bacterium]|jgi:phosphohistidine phosphatase|nr:histidine phosphatase family protein [Bacteroidales bacterium]MDG2080697.1 histidine phosphatase family protein [Bacteroidales bacterium]|tara:strand:+ start:2451 stop:2945 length:495 start_codon:yes stop_codon:yes gene_type:complete
MKLLTLVRHAKSSWSNSDLSDHDRPLNNAGVKKTKKVINYMLKSGFLPELILSSTAKRAIETAKIIAGGIGFDVDKIITKTSIYHADIDDIYSEVFSLDNKINSLMIVGHNPTFTYLVNDFVYPNIKNLPTTGAVSIIFETDEWEQIPDAKFKVNFVVFPSILP